MTARRLDLNDFKQTFWYTVAALCAVAVVDFVLRTWSWPFMGDSGYLHYVVFLTRHGMAPYRDIVEINTPGSYITERLAMAVWGAGAIGWRLFDFSLLALTFASYFRILRGVRAPLTLLVATVFLAIHGQDGVMMSGERDLTAAVLQIVAVAMLLQATGINSALPMRAVTEPALDSQRAGVPHSPPARAAALALVAGFLLSWSACIKPTNLLLLLAAFSWTAAFARKPARGRLLLSLAAGAMLPWLICLAYLLHYHALGAYSQELHGIVAYYVSLDRKSVAYLLTHACSPILWLFLLALPLAVSRKRSEIGATEALLLLAAAAAVLSYFVQAKGFAYQRYPILIFLLPLLAIWLRGIAPHRLWRQALRACLIAAMLISVCLMVHKAATYSHADPNLALMADLESLGANHASGSIQCLDYAGGCIQTLYKERLVQTTGVIYDCYFQDALKDGRNVAVGALRSNFMRAIERTPPAWIIETDSSCFSSHRTFDKYPDWTRFNKYVNANYVAVLEHQSAQPEHYWSRREPPFGYRIYRRK